MKAHSEKCPSCGKQHLAGFAFCPRCGASLGESVNGDGPLRRRVVMTDFEDADAMDLNGRLLQIIEQGRSSDAVRLYQEAVGCNRGEAQAAINELSKQAEFQLAPSRAAKTAAKADTGWLSRCLAKVRGLMD